MFHTILTAIWHYFYCIPFVRRHEEIVSQVETQED